jgi:hypothetical protein
MLLLTHDIELFLQHQSIDTVLSVRFFESLQHPPSAISFSACQQTVSPGWDTHKLREIAVDHEV